MGGDRFSCDTLRVIKAAILNEEVSLNIREVGLSDDSIQQLLSKEIKKRNDSAEAYEKAGRQDLSEIERREIGVLLKYLPKQLSDDEIRQTISKLINDLGGKDSCQMGKVIGAVKLKLGNSADGSRVARLVKDIFI